MLIPMPSPRGTNRERLFVDVPSRGATDSVVGYDTPPRGFRPRRFGDTRMRPARDDDREGYLRSLLEQLKLLEPEEQRDLLDELLGDMPSEDRRRDRRARDGEYPVEERDIADPGAIGGLPRSMPGDRRTTGDEPPPFYGRPRPGGTIDWYADRTAGDRRQHAMDAARRIRVDTVGVQPSPRSPRSSASFAARFPSAARIRVL